LGWLFSDLGWLFVNLGWLWLGLFWLISGHIFFDPTFLNSHHPFSWNINETNSCWDHLRPLPFQSPRRPISSSSKIRKTNQYKATMKRTSEDIITARNPGEILAIDLNNIMKNDFSYIFSSNAGVFINF